MTTTRKQIIALTALLQLLLLLPLSASAAANLGNASWKNTVEAFVRIPCMTCDQVDYGKQVIRGLDYNSQRIFRKMSLLKDANFASSQRAWDALVRLHLSYEQMLAFEDWADLHGATMKIGLTALPAIKSLNYEAGKSFRAYLKISGIKPYFAL